MKSIRTLLDEVSQNLWLSYEAMVILIARRKTHTRKQEQRRKYEMQENERGLSIYSRALEDFGHVELAQNK